MGLFHKDFEPGPIVLGGNVADGEALAVQRAMYCVMITKLP